MLRNKRVLITAGPTWVPIDGVRVLSNTATGETGFILAHEARLRKAHVTLIMGPGSVTKKLSGVALKPFRYFDELKSTLQQTLNKGTFDVVIQSAAVSDYKSEKIFKHKISSHNQRVRLELVPTTKLIRLVKKFQPQTVLVGFKYEIGLKKNALIKEARDLMHSSCADVVVANTLMNGKYCAYIVRNNGIVSSEIHSKTVLAKALFNICEQIIV